MLGAHQDITELKRREQELIKASEKVRESEEKYRPFTITHHYHINRWMKMGALLTLTQCGQKRLAMKEMK
jgi:hypothetical protein